MMSLITPPAVESILHLPVQLSSFVGREAERRTLVDLLREQRLVTLVGAPGIGKTRLALRIGNELASAFADGVWFVELADVADPTTVSDAVSAALGIPERSGVSRAAAL